MSLIELLFGRKQKTATVARDRLQIIIAQERAQEGQTRITCRLYVKS